MEKKVHWARRLIGMPTKVWIKFQTTSCQLTLRKTIPNKTRKAGDIVTAAAPLAERMRPPGLNALQLRTDREICDRTWMKQTTMHLIVL